MENWLECSERNSRCARALIDRLHLFEAWRAEGIEPRPVGSLAMGLLSKHRDIDLHCYSSPVDIARSFAAVARIAAAPGVEQVTCANRLDTEERCLEWHLRCRDTDDRLWTVDMIHIERGSRYDGYFERMAMHIRETLTPEQRNAILRLKWEVPEGEYIPGVLIYMAVMRDGVRTMEELVAWRAAHPADGIVTWIP